MGKSQVIKLSAREEKDLLEEEEDSFRKSKSKIRLHIPISKDKTLSFITDREVIKPKPQTRLKEAIELELQ